MVGTSLCNPDLPLFNIGVENVLQHQGLILTSNFNYHDYDAVQNARKTWIPGFGCNLIGCYLIISLSLQRATGTYQMP